MKRPTDNNNRKNTYQLVGKTPETPRVRNSAQLTSAELKKFREYVNSFTYREDAWEALDISRPTGISIHRNGRGKTTTISKVLSIISPVQNSAHGKS